MKPGDLKCRENSIAFSVRVRAVSHRAWPPHTRCASRTWFTLLALQAFVWAPFRFLPFVRSQGGVEASRGWVSFYLPTPSLQRIGFPWEPPTSFQAPTRFPEEPI